MWQVGGRGKNELSYPMVLCWANYKVRQLNTAIPPYSQICYSWLSFDKLTMVHLCKFRAVSQHLTHTHDITVCTCYFTHNISQGLAVFFLYFPCNHAFQKKERKEKHTAHYKGMLKVKVKVRVR
jgi:hypothetical protein